MTRIFRAIVLLLAAASVMGAQEKLAFDVASVRLNRSADEPSTNVPLTKGDFYPANGGVFSVRAMPLVNLLNFAYKLSDFQKQELLAHAPGWVASDHYNVEARSDRTPTKDQMRGMVRALLAERFALVVHQETRQVAILGMVLAKPGVLGPSLRPHLAGDAECAKAESFCGAFGIVPASVPGRRKIVGRDVRLQMVADEIAGLGGLGRQVFDRTGLAGTYDFSLEWVPASDAAAVDGGGATFLEALREQMGVRLEGQKGPVEYVVVDHVERATGN